jgi:hypothetical protein
MNSSNKSYRLAVCITIALSLVVVLLVGCGEKQSSSSDNVVSEVVMTTSVDANGRPLNPTTVFSDNASAFYCSFKISGFPVGSQIKAKWILVGGNPEAVAITGPNALIEEQTGTIERKGKGYTFAVLPMPPMPDYTWPHGDYKVVISVVDQEKGSAYFKVE